MANVVVIIVSVASVYQGTHHTFMATRCDNFERTAHRFRNIFIRREQRQHHGFVIVTRETHQYRSFAIFCDGLQQRAHRRLEPRAQSRTL